VPVVVVLLLSSLITLVLGTLCFRLVQSIQTLAGAADKLGTSASFELPHFFVQELDNVGSAMNRAGEQLAQNREQLETRIRETTEKLNREAEERRKLEADIAHSQRLDALGRLTGGVAHDFNNLLTVIMGNLEVIARTGSAERREQLCDSALRAAGRGARLVKALLAFARKEPAQQITVDPNVLIEEFANVLKGALGDAVTLQLRLSPTVHACCLDPAQLQTALLNLATNARDAMPNGGQLTIATENAAFLAESDATINRAFSLPEGSYVRISVRDTGTGMTAGVVERAFEPFYTTKEVGSGSGLGLAQVYGFVKQSGGEINIESELGQGTTISLYFPKALGSVIDAESAPAAFVEKNQPRETIMVVDDDPDVRNVLVEQLEILGYAVISARDGQEALAKLRRGDHADIVLSDYQMPNGLSGRDLVHRVQEIAPHTKIVLISGFIANDGRLADLGVPVLGKPIRSDELAKAIREVIAAPAP
jgi:signal transduction histidine kinase/CheY-like chemotaxis protein